MSDESRKRLLALIRKFHDSIKLGMKVPWEITPDNFRRIIWRERGLGPAIAENVASLKFTADAARLRRALDNFYGMIDPPHPVQTVNNPDLFTKIFIHPLHRRIEELANVLGDVYELVDVTPNSEKDRGGPPKKTTQQQPKIHTPTASANPVVFISSTFEDLKEHRAKARDVILRFEFVPRMQEYFEASGSPPLEECLKKVSGSPTEPAADVVILIIAHRYGWIPELQSGSECKSITWLECEEAQKNGKDVLAFIVEESYSWPPDQIEKDPSKVELLKRFKNWIDDTLLRKTFTTPDSLASEISAALHSWDKRACNR